MSLIKRDQHALDLKRSIGGIHELELIVQILQIINFSKLPNPSETNLLQAIEQLENINILTMQRSKVLKNAYEFFRKTETAIRLIRNRATELIQIEPIEIQAFIDVVNDNDILNMNDFQRKIQSQMNHCHQVFNEIKSL